jgi:hypothetical protein
LGALNLRSPRKSRKVAAKWRFREPGRSASLLPKRAF